MKIKMWCLIDKKKDKVIQVVGFPGDLAVGFATKKDLMSAIFHIEDNEEIRKIEIEV